MASTNEPRRNRLDAETSPYLQQHADNPVDWYPWGEEALQTARRQNKPILLSIGYSACHWCHVMAHESFESDETAKIMNELFVNVKVDREERPDIDQIYQTAHQLLTQRPGGWPLTMFIDPSDQRPFFGGTYFPDKPRHGMPAFSDLLKKAAGFFREQPEDVQAQSAQLKEVFKQLEPRTSADAELSTAPLALARDKIGSAMDREYGGMGSSPKFPHPTTLERLLRHWQTGAHEDEPDIDALYLVTLTLKQMANGGLFDQLGGGFYRYSVDRFWQIPHFEKMLYDNGELLALYAQAHLATGDASFCETADSIARWLIDDMRSPDGGFYAARDADSDGVEGAYYVWNREQLQEHLDDTQYSVVFRRFGIDQEPNFEDAWHLTVRADLDEIAVSTGLTENEVREQLSIASSRLLAVRSKRTAPARDEKQLTAWNALAIRGLAISARTLQRDDLASAAAETIDFCMQCSSKNGRLYAVYKDGQARFPAYLDDHAFLLNAVLEVLQTRWQSSYLRFATTLADRLLENFLDSDTGGFFFTAHDHEKLMHRPKPLADDATPSGNGIAAQALQRLGFLLGEARYLDAAESTLRLAWQPMSEYPHGHVSLITALEEFLTPPEIIVIRGSVPDINEWQREVTRLYAPARLVFAIPADETDLPGALAQRAAKGDSPVAYRCVGSTCSLPFQNLNDLCAALRASAP